MMRTVASYADDVLDDTRGHVSFMVHQDPFTEPSVRQTAGVRFRIEPDPGVDLYYLGPLMLPNTTLTETTGAGGAGAVNMPAGAYDLIIEETGGPCSRILSWDFEPGYRIPFEVEAGRATYFDFLCPAGDGP